jgi:hypothetical protein
MNISRITVRKDVAGGLEVQTSWYEKRSIHVVGRQKDAGMAQGEPPGGVGEGGLASQLT